MALELVLVREEDDYYDVKSTVPVSRICPFEWGILEQLILEGKRIEVITLREDKMEGW